MRTVGGLNFSAYTLNVALLEQCSLNALTWPARKSSWRIPVWPVFPIGAKGFPTEKGKPHLPRYGSLLKVLGSDPASVPVLPLSGPMTLVTLHKSSLPIFFLSKRDMIMTSQQGCCKNSKRWCLWEHLRSAWLQGHTLSSSFSFLETVASLSVKTSGSQILFLPQRIIYGQLEEFGNICLYTISSSWTKKLWAYMCEFGFVTRQL